MPLRTVTLPTAPGATWDDFAWDPKAPGDELHYTLDAGAWLADAGEVVQSVAVSCSPGLVVADVGFEQGDTGVVLQLAGGVPGTVAVVLLALTLTGSDVLTVLVALPINAGAPAGLVAAWPPPDVPAGALSVAGTPITVGGLFIQFAAAGTPPAQPVTVAGTPVTVAGLTIQT